MPAGQLSILPDSELRQKSNYARIKPERVKLCQNYAENYVRKVTLPDQVVIMSELSYKRDYAKIMLDRFKLCRNNITETEGNYTKYKLYVDC